MDLCNKTIDTIFHPSAKLLTCQVKLSQLVLQRELSVFYQIYVALSAILYLCGCCVSFRELGYFRNVQQAGVSKECLDGRS